MVSRATYKQVRTTVGLLLFALAAVVFLLAVKPTQAQDAGDLGNGLRINVLRREFTIFPGQEETYDIEVTNVSSGRLIIATVVNDFTSDNETGQPRLLTGPNESSPFSLAEYVELPAPFELAPSETETVTLHVAMPDDVLPGGYFGAIRFAPTNIEGEEGTIALTASVGSLLLVSVPGDAEESMTLQFLEARDRLDDGQTIRRKLFETEPDLIAVGLENGGNTILQPFGRVSIKDMFDRELYSYEFNGGQSRGNVLPKSSRTFENDVENVGPIGRYIIEVNLSYGEGGGNIITASSTFWVVPWRLLLAVIAGLALIIWLATRGIKVYNRRVIERSKRSS